jgi:methionyl-tRNA formyltransferase
MGTPEFAGPSLHAVAAACDVVAVVTQPDRPRGRGQHPAPSVVATIAEGLGIPILKPERANEPALRERLAALGPDLFAVVAFGAILAPALLAVPRLGSINLHGSLLPEYRGASPVQRALWDGRGGTGVTTLWMDEGIDTGDCILQRWVGIEAGDNAGTLGSRLAEAGAPLLAESLTLAHAGRAPRVPQPREAGSYARKLAKLDGIVDWSLDVESVWNRQRAVTPWPGATSGLRGKRLMILEARPLHRLPAGVSPGAVVAIATEGVAVACGTGVLTVTRVKPEGRSEMTATEWARGARLEPGEPLQWEKETIA